MSNLILAGKQAATDAIRENRALGLAFTYTKGNKVVRENANGEIENLESKPLRSTLKIKKRNDFVCQVKVELDFIAEPNGSGTNHT